MSAVDDCRKVDLTFEDKDAPTCSAIIGIKAVALGCENRILEDTTEIDVMVAVDDTKPQVTCELGTQDLEGKGDGALTDLDFSFTAVDECTDTDDLAVTIEVFSNEKAAIVDEVSFISEPVSARTLTSIGLRSFNVSFLSICIRNDAKFRWCYFPSLSKLMLLRKS